MNEYKFESVIIIKPEIEEKAIAAIVAEVNKKVKNLKVEEIGLKTASARLSAALPFARECPCSEATVTSMCKLLTMRPA